MRYFRQTLQYLFAFDKGIRFIKLLLIALPAAAAIGYYFPITGYLEWFASFTENGFATYGEMWLQLVSKDSLQLLILIAGYILLIAAISAICTLIMRSIRLGKFQFKSIFFLINENVFPGFFIATFLLVSLLSYHSLICLFLFLWQKVLLKTAALIVSIITMLLGLTLLMLAYSTQALWLPIMAYYGVRSGKALGLSISKGRAHIPQLFMCYMFLLMVVLGLGLLCMLIRSAWYVTWIINSLSYAFAIVYIVTLSMVSFFDIEGIPREDLAKKPYLWR